METLNSTTDVDQHPYVVEMATPDTGETTLLACETASEVLGIIIDGYEDLDDTDALKARVTLIEDQVLPVVNERVYADHLGKGGAKLDARDEEILLSAYKGDFGPIEWRHEEFPLTVASTQFLDDDEPRPSGNVVIVDVEDELGVIKALTAFGVLTVHMKA